MDRMRALDLGDASRAGSRGRHEDEGEKGGWNER